MSENGFQINTEVNVKTNKKKRKSKKKLAIRGVFLGIAVLLVAAIALVIFGYTVPTSSVTYLDKSVKECQNNDSAETKFYDNDGKIIKEVHSTLSTGIENIVYTYIYDGDKIVKQEAVSMGMPWQYTDYIYEGGVLARRDTYTIGAEGNVLTSKEEYRYNADGTVALLAIYPNEGDMTEKTYTYEAGKLMSETTLNPTTGYTETTTYIYEGDNVVKKVRSGERFETSTEFVYDDRGNVLREMDSTGNYYLYNYSYGSKKVPMLKK